MVLQRWPALGAKLWRCFLSWMPCIQLGASATPFAASPKARGLSLFAFSIAHLLAACCSAGSLCPRLLCNPPPTALLCLCERIDGPPAAPPPTDLAASLRPVGA